MVRVRVAALVLSLLLPVIVTAAPAGPRFQGDPQAIAEVQAAFQKFGAAKSWRARMSSPQGGTQTMEHVTPDRYRMVLTQGNQTTEMFIIGNEMWLRQGGTCQKMPAAVPVQNPRQYVEHETDTTITVTKGGPETVEGTPTQTYMMTVETRGQQSRQKLFVATGTGLPRRIEVQSQQGTTTIDYLDYDAPITISNPPC